jgi:maltokinase
MKLSATELGPMLETWLPTQRWFAAKGRDFVISPRELAAVGAGPPEVSVWIVDVRFADGTGEAYQLPLVERVEPATELEHILIGTIVTDTGPRWIYDALYDHDATQAYLLGLRDQPTDGAVRFERYVEAGELPIGSSSLVLTGEQSNTSLIFGDQTILKVYRRLEQGLNPDIEIHLALTELGAKHIARLYGSVTADLDGAPVSLAMMQEFMTSGVDGWELSKTSVRDLMAEGDLHADEAGGDFASEAYRLGVAVAEVHADLARAFGTGALDAAQREVRAREMHERLDRAVAVVPDLEPVEDGLRRAFDDFGASPMRLETQRIHGDLHLGQALRTVHRWVLLDFEGEPASSIAQRRLFDSPLRDLAGMLRSFEYAARYPVLNTPGSSQLEYRAGEWAQRNRDAFLDGYTEGAGHDPRDDIAAIRGFEADKAVYEAIYEARNRPRWLRVPLASLSRLAHTADAGTEPGHGHRDRGPRS